MGHLHMKRKELRLNRDKPPDTDLEDKNKTNVVFCTTVDPSTTKEEKILRYMQTLPHQIKQGKQIHLLHVLIKL